MANGASDSTRPFSGKTAWARNLETPLREFIGTETGSAGVLLVATIAALLWINVDSSSYRGVWEPDLVVRLGDHSITLDLRGWVNSGLMTLFFFVVGLEARRDFDLGELRERRRILLPVLADLGGAATTVGVYLAFNAGRPSAHGWGTAMCRRPSSPAGSGAATRCDLPGRAAAAAVPPVVGLRNRPGVRARERGDSD